MNCLLDTEENSKSKNSRRFDWKLTLHCAAELKIYPDSQAKNKPTLETLFVLYTNI